MGFNMKDLQKMQAKLMQMQTDLEHSSFTGTAGGGAVSITMNGKFEVTAVKLQQEAVDPGDVSMLEDLILAACQDAFGKVGEQQAKMMGAMTGGMGLPRGMGF